jgi:hypothetical protein
MPESALRKIPCGNREAHSLSFETRAVTMIDEALDELGEYEVRLVVEKGDCASSSLKEL